MSKLFNKNKKGRDFCVGDLHGCYDLFQSVLSEIDFDKKIDRMFSVGDLTDRGTQNMECLRLIKENWFFPVIGNHDDFIIKSILHGDDPYLWVMNGGNWHFDVDPVELKQLALLLKKLPYSMKIETDDGIVAISHAQPPSNDWSDAENPDKQAINIMIWGRDWIENNCKIKAKGVFRSIHGHTIVHETVNAGNAFFIDTGAFHTGKLTCIMIS